MFTAARIAAALARPARSVRRLLGTIDPDGTLLVNGNPAAAWLLCSLPARLQAEIEEEARRRGYDSGERLLLAPPDRWEPALPLTVMDPSVVTQASNLQRALSPTLERLHADLGTDQREILDQGLAHYSKVLGHRISLRHLERLVDRTIERDHGAENWSRLEIFLPDRIATKKATVVAFGFEDEWQAMLKTVAAVVDKTAATPEELCLFWDQAFACYEHRIAAGTTEKRARQELRKLIEQKVPFVSARGHALHLKIKRTLARWTAGGRTAGAVADGRHENPGRPRASALPKEYADRLVARAIQTAGGLAQAFRESQQEGWCPAKFAQAYPFNPLLKSYVPATIRAELQPRIERLAPHVIGPRNAKLRGAYVDRDYSGVPSGLEFQADDCTLPAYFWIPDANGNPTLDENGRPVLTRGQLLPWIDCRTTFVLTFQLLTTRTYNAMDIMRGIARVHDVYGLPECFYFEHGTWESQLIEGSRGENVPWKEFAYGLDDIGVKVHHAEKPQAKIIERVLGALQDRMNNLRGYCGRDESKDCPEETKRAKALVLSGKAHPSEFFYSHSEWMREIERICNAYNAEIQNGKILPGQSPAGSFVALRKSPPIQLPPELRYLLARHRCEKKVTTNGITIRGKYIYKSDRLGAMIGERVLVWFNIEDPESVCITDLNHENPFTVRRATSVSSYEPEPEQLAQALRENAAQDRPAREEFGKLVHAFPEEFQRKRRALTLAPSPAVALGVEMESQRLASAAAARDQDKLNDKAKRLARGMGLKNVGRVDAERVDAMEKLNRAGVKSVNPYSYEDET